ncbi:VOC family protein [Rhizobium wuzhouense]|uniref:Glyoxalase n=1 Tax=Rhizobium wuzhouense TaxID=1986026 RepID=A0ABX5NW82_9HYPH|nr:VOC family protein [Rhizobium wuzhouense]PYB77345.1 glyoxalase [Rhizobium wuzhouense]
MALLALHHVQLAMPLGGEDRARGFYGEVLGLVEVQKPDNLARRGGCWFELGALRIHLGVEQDFRAARKAHPALLVDDLAELTARIEAAGYEVVSDESLEGFERRYVYDPFGNRIELMQTVG